MSSCEVAQLRQVKNGQESVTVLTLAIAQTAPQDGKGDKPGLLLTAVTPLNVYLPDGLIFSVDGKPAGKVNYRNCNQSGCWAQLRLDGDFLTSLRKGSEAEVRFRLVNGRNVNVGASLKGLTAALNGLEKGELR